MTRASVRHLGIVLIVATAAWLGSAELGRERYSAQAHTVSKRGNFFWALGSRTHNGSRILDPINIQWIHGSIYDDTEEGHVRDVVEQNWGARSPGGPPPDRQRMLFGSVCLGQSGIARRFSESGIQDVIFKGQGGRGNRRQDTQYQGSTSSHCFTQWHMRFWDDHVHDDISTDHGSIDQWAISGVHHDISKCSYRVPPVVGPRFGGCHEISGRWNAYRDYAVRRAMKHLCGKSHWKQHPGSDRNFQGHRFDGYIARIELTYDGPGCDRGLR